MSVIDDITAILTPVLHTNTTKDITAAAVKAALISAFTDVVNDETTRVTAAEAAATAAKATAALAARSSNGMPIDLLGADGMRVGQSKFGLQNLLPRTGSEGVMDSQINGSTGAPTGQGTVLGWVVSGFIPVIPGSVMTVGKYNYGGLSGGVGEPFYKYGATRNYLGSGIAGAAGGAWAHGENFTVPSDTYFLRYAYDYSQIHRIMLFQGDIDPADLPYHKWQGMASTVHMHRPWTGRKWMYTGDSMGAQRSGNSWVSDVAKYHGCSFLINNAIDGGTVSEVFGTDHSIMTKYNRPTDFSRVNLVAGDLTGVHAVIVQAGVNDLSGSVAIGTINDAPTAATFYGQYVKFIEFILGSNPNLKLILSPPSGKHYPGGPTTGGETRTGVHAYAARSPWQGPADSYGPDDETLIQPYRDAVYALCERYALNCWDVPRHSQFSAFTALAYSDDGLHPQYAFAAGRPDGNPDHLPTQTSWGSRIVFASSLAAYMHTVFPADWFGDPWIAEGDSTYQSATF